MAKELLEEALRVFKIEARNRFNEGSAELRHNIRMVYIDALRAGLQNAIVKANPLYIAHAKKLGKDFLSAFGEVVRPVSNVIPEKSGQALMHILTIQYEEARKNAKHGIHAYAESRGIESKTLIQRGEGCYYDVESTYCNRLEAAIAKHNLFVNTGETHSLPMVVLEEAKKRH